MRIFARLAFLILCGTGVVILIFLTADLPNNRKNGFTRRFFSTGAKPISERTLSSTVRSLADMHHGNIYLYTDSVDRLLKTEYSLKKIETVQIPLSATLAAQIGNVFSIRTTQGFTHIFANNFPGIISINKHTGKTTSFKTNRAFSSAAILSNNTFIVRQFAPTHKSMQFTRFHVPSGRFKTENNISLSTQARGLLSGDGQIHYDSSTYLLTYVHYYYNTILTFDTLLNPVKQFPTIDTVQHIPAGRKHPLVINQKSCVDEGMLYICSNLKADNETPGDYRKNIPVDMYQIATGTYIGSFYLPVSEGKLIKSILVNRHTLAALYHDNKLMIFSIHHILQEQGPLALL